MVSDQELASCVESLLRQSVADPSGGGGLNPAINLNAVVQQLEAKLGLELSHKAPFIRDQINLLLRPPPPNPNPNPNPKDHPHFALQHHHQQQFLQHYHQIPVTSPFTHLPHHHELAFRMPPAISQQQFQHQQLQQQQLQHQQQAAEMMQKNEGHFTPGPTAAKAPKASGVKRRGGPGGLSKVCGVSPELQTIVGEPAMPRTQIVKQLWAYIRKNNLQDPGNKRKIICNDELRLVFETDCTDMFKMNKLLAKHILPLEPSKEPGQESKKLKTEEAVSSTESDADQCPVMISDTLAKFFGTGEREMLQSEALKRIWDYIKANQLEDTMMVMCDEKLQQLFGCESLSSLGVSEMVARHLFKQS